MNRRHDLDRCKRNESASPARPARRLVATLSAAAIAIALAAVVAMPTGRAQTGAPLDTTPSRSTLDEASGDGCGSVSVVVRRCAAPVPAPADPAPDELTRSREKAKAGFDRGARRGTRDALDRPSTDAGGGATPDATNGAAPAVAPVGPAQRLAPVTVTGHDDDPPQAPETVLQRALNPNQVVLPNGNIVTYMPDGDRSECLAQCVGPACCKIVRARPNPARLSNSIGQ